MKRFSLSLLFFLVLVAATAAQSSISQNQASSQTSATTKADHAPTASEIAAAKASHKVWVNLDTGIYHKGGRWYGKTKDGRFMTLDEAKKAGYKAAKRD